MGTRIRSGLTSGYLALGLSVLALGGCYRPDVLSVSTSDGQHYCFTVTIADTPDNQRQGLMYIQSLPRYEGMLFNYADEQPRSMWMKNTYVPLDMLFIRADGAIANIARNTTPHSLTSIGSEGNVKAVLEINGGLTDELNIRADDTVHHEVFDNPRVCWSLLTGS